MRYTGKRRLRKIFGFFFLLLGLLFSDVSFAAEAAVSDIQGHWAGQTIRSWIEKGLAVGYRDGTFKPDQHVTRAEFVALVNKTFGFKDSMEANFKDVRKTDWYYNEISAAITEGYLKGYQDNTFQPSRYVTREEAAAILSRILMLNGPDSVTDINDMDTLSEWSRDAVLSMLSSQYMSGYPDRTFRPSNYLTRAEAIVTLEGAVNKTTIIDKPGIYTLGTVYGTALIKAPDVTLRNTYVKGVLIVDAEASGSVIKIEAGSEISKMIIMTNVDIQGTGKILTAVIKASGVRMEMKPDLVEQDEGVEAVIGYGSSSTSGMDGNKTGHNTGGSGGGTGGTGDNTIEFTKLVEEVQAGLVIEIRNPTGKNATPSILLPITDTKSYGTTISWTADNSEYIVINGEDAAIFRRGINAGDDSGCGDEGDDDSECGGESDDESEAGGPGGRVTKVILSASISKGEVMMTKDFPLNIPWGWGRAITIGDNSPGEHEAETPPCGIESQVFKLWLGQFQLFLTAEDLADRGDTVVSAEIEQEAEAPCVELKITKDGRLCVVPAKAGANRIKAVVANKDGSAEVSFDVLVQEPAAVDDSAAVAGAKAGLVLRLFSSGNGPKQVNKIAVPDTDPYGYGTSITWTTNNDEYVVIENNHAFIYRRGSGGNDGCDDGGLENSLMIESTSECGDSGGDDGTECGGDEGAGGKKTVVELTAAISRNEARDTKTFKITIPWGWGKRITIEEQ